jgi:uncharacterized protein YqeY
MSLKVRISDDMKSAMKAKETERLAAIRLLMAAIKQKEVDERIELDDAAIVVVIDKMLKQRRDSISQYEAAQRQDLADKEKAEMTVLMAYMPQQLSEAEIDELVAKAVVDSACCFHAGHGQGHGPAASATGWSCRHGTGFGAYQGQARCLISGRVHMARYFFPC